MALLYILYKAQTQLEIKVTNEGKNMKILFCDLRSGSVRFRFNILENLKGKVYWHLTQVLKFNQHYFQ